MSRLPQLALDIASEVEAAETRIKEEVLAAARVGDTDRVISIMERWLTEPPSEVLAGTLLDASESR